MLQVPTLDEVTAELCRRRLRDFITHAWPIVEPGVTYSHNWHIDAMCEHLEACERREIRRLIINVPPRTMKSRTCSVFFPAWTWLRAPHTKFLYSSYAQDLAIEHSVDTRGLIESQGGRQTGGTVFERHGYQGVLQLLGQDWALADDANLKTRFQNTAGGYRFATSVGARVTGFGGDIIVADDPHNAKNAESDIERASVITWWDRAMSTRLNDPKTGVYIVVMQRLHESDLTGHILAKDMGYEHLCLPMEYEPSHPFVWPQDPRTSPDELLWPDRVGPDEITSLKTSLGSYGAAGQLQQRPAPAEGGIFKTAWWGYYDPSLLEADQWHGPHFTRLVMSMDTTMKEKTTSDYAVCQLWGHFGPDRYLLRAARGRWGLTETVTQAQTMLAWAKTRFPGLTPQVLVENKANGPEVIAALRKQVQGVVPVNPSVDKVTRAQAITPQLEAGNVLLPGDRIMQGAGWAPDPTRTPAWVQELIDECAGFPNGANDDQVDALTQALDPRRAGAAAKVRTGALSGRRGPEG